MIVINDVIPGILLHEGDLSLEELAKACAVDSHWVIQHIENGVIAQESQYVSSLRFTSADLKRARRIRQLEYDFEAAPELAAITVDLLEEVERLRKLLQRSI